MSKRLLTGCLAVLIPWTGGCFSALSAADSADAAAKCLQPDDADRMADQVIELVNLERAQRNLQPVASSEKLTRMADDFACRMIEGKFFGHRDPETGYGPGERAVAAKYMFYAVGENLAAGQQTPAEVVRLWMESESHRNIILDPTWREIGVAVRAGGEHGLYWVLEFGDPADF